MALFGPAFKPNTDDVREASSLKIAKALLEAEAHVSAFDPVERKSRSLDLKCSNAQLDPGLSVRCACCVVVAEWGQFKALTPDDFIEHMAQDVVVDARRIFDPRQFCQG